MVPAEVLTHMLAWHILALFLRPSDQTWPGLGMGYKTSVVLLPCVCYPSATPQHIRSTLCGWRGHSGSTHSEKGEHRFWSLFCGVCRISPLPRAAPAAPSLAPKGSLCPDAGGTFLCHPGARQPGAQPRGSHNAQCPPTPPQLPIRLRSLRCAHGPAAPITRGVAALSAGPDGGERHKGQRRSLRGAPLRALSPTRAELCAPAHLCSGRGAPRRPSSAPHLRPCAIYGAAPGAGLFRAAAVCLGKVSTGCSGPCFLLHRLFPPLCPALGLPSLAPTWWGSGQPGFVARCLVVRWGCGSCRLDCPPPSVPSVALICAGVGSGAGGMETLFGNESCLFGRRAAYEPQARVTPASL